MLEEFETRSSHETVISLSVAVAFNSRAGVDWLKMARVEVALKNGCGPIKATTCMLYSAAGSRQVTEVSPGWHAENYKQHENEDEIEEQNRAGSRTHLNGLSSTNRDHCLRRHSTCDSIHRLGIKASSLEVRIRQKAAFKGRMNMGVKNLKINSRKILWHKYKTSWFKKRTLVNCTMYITGVGVCNAYSKDQCVRRNGDLYFRRRAMKVIHKEKSSSARESHVRV